MSSTPQRVQADAQQIFSDATDAIAQQEKARAERKPPAAPIKRERAVAIGLVVSLPVLVVVLVVNFAGVNLLALFEPRPSEAEARVLAQQTLDRLVAGVEAYREDYHELPAMLSQVELPEQGEWTYRVTLDGRFRIHGNLYGQVVTFESATPPPRAIREQE